MYYIRVHSSLLTKDYTLDLIYAWRCFYLKPCVIFIVFKKAIKMTNGTKTINFLYHKEIQIESMCKLQGNNFFLLYSMQILHKSIPKSDT